MPDIFNLFTAANLFKLGFLILNGILIAYLLVVFQQAQSMRKVIDDNGGSNLINLVALANIVVAIAIFVAALIIL